MKFQDALLLFAGSLTAVNGINNGKGITPPMGWRSWNLFGDNVNQALIQGQMDGIASRKRMVNGVPTSLADLGYKDVGLDDAWQLCGHYGSKKYTYHDEDGKPIVNLDFFPDFKQMTDYAHNLGLTAGWYANNCICSDHCVSDECYQEDVNALINYGFDSVKLDACGKELNLQKWADLIDASGKSILIENCHWGRTVPNATWCPWNYYRTSGDVRANYESIISNLMTTVPFAKQQLSTPGCWAYPDMLEVGCEHGPGGENDPGLSFIEARTHFGAWSIVSSPLILSHDTNNDTVTDEIWPIITNTEAIAVNQAWDGDSGSLFAESEEKIVLSGYVPNENEPKKATVVGVWQQWAKRMSADSSAVLVINNSEQSQTVTVDFTKIPTFSSTYGSIKASVRDIWNHADLGTAVDSMSFTLESHDSAFVIFKKV